MTRPRNHQGAVAGLLGLAAAVCACASRPVVLEAPNIAPSEAREPTPVELDPIATGDAVVGDYAPPGPAVVLTAAIQRELDGRALHGADAVGYLVRCRLDRFAAPAHVSVTGGEMLLLYADLSCEADRRGDGVPVWRGELRGRSAATSANLLGSDAGARQRLLGRALSDAAREMASDLALRALGLVAAPSARVFGDEAQEHDGAGLDDGPFGPAALEESAASVPAALRAIADHDARVRAAAWNVVAMAAGPGDAWMAGPQLALDDDPLPRFVQYKALARLGGPLALAELRSAADRDDDGLLAELAADAVRSGGIGMARRRR